MYGGAMDVILSSLNVGILNVIVYRAFKQISLGFVFQPWLGLRPNSGVTTLVLWAKPTPRID